LLGPILTAPYSTPTTDEVPAVLRPLLRKANALVLERHGALTLGRTLDEAWQRMEAMEHAAKILHAAAQLGPLSPLPAVEVDKLQALASRLHIPRAPEPPTVASVGNTAAPIDSDSALVEAVLRRLQASAKQSPR
jgi:ribulose-5-phosphate 4-epimerase/fuculose-1-phosphate aldolase